MHIKNLKLPAFLPDATYGSVKSISFEDLKRVGITGIVTNTLHIENVLGSQYIKNFGGIHKFFNWNNFILTDSGGWQVFSLINSKKNSKNFVTEAGCSFFDKSGKQIFLSPETSIIIQSNLSPDAMVVLDYPILGNSSLSERKKCVYINTNWAKRSLKKYNQIYGNSFAKPLLSAVIQGGDDFALRKQSATQLLDLGLPMYNFGGMPMYYGETWKTEKEYRLFHEMLVFVSNLIPNNKIKYAMGVGQPIDIAFCVDYGWNLFDTVLPTRNARHGYLYVSSLTNVEEKDIKTYTPKNLLKGKVNSEFLSYSILRIKNEKYKYDNNPVDSSCSCECCKSISRAYLRHLIRINEPSGFRLATIHNLNFFSRYLKNLNIANYI